MIRRIQTALRSYSKYLQSRYDNMKFAAKLKGSHLPMPEGGFVLDKPEFSKLYPELADYYPEQSFLQALGKRGKVDTVAVVFNSGTILENKLGEDIDKNDLVIRINFLPTKGYEAHTGARTDIRILGRNWLFQEEGEVMIHTYNSPEYPKRDLEVFQNMKGKKLNEKLYVFDNSKWEDIYNYLGGNPTNGFRAVVFGLSLGKRVKIYGTDKASRTWRKGKTISHFPSEKDVDYVKDLMAPYNLRHQEYDRYFGTNAMKNGQVKTIHFTINREYMFYDFNDRVEII